MEALSGGGSEAAQQLPASIETDGKTRRVTQHLRDNARPGITAQRVAHVLEHWLIRGVRTEQGGRQSACFIAFVPGMAEMVRVAVSMDDERIINAFPDRTATRHWDRGNRSYFTRVYGELEVRDEN